MTDIGTNGGKYQTQIPALGDNADIQTALRLYHYGVTSEPSTLIAESVAGHLNTLENTKVDIIPTPVIAGATNDLDLKVTTGYYVVSTNSIASTGSNYPPPATAGILHVINDGAVVYQTYISNTSRFYWRAKFSGTWSSWKEGSDTAFVPASVGTRLSSLEAAIDTKQPNIIGSLTTVIGVTLGANKVVVTDGSGKIIESPDITTTELGSLNGAANPVHTVVLGNKAAGTPVPAGIKRVVIARETSAGSNVPDATITPVEGDLWFW